MHMTECTDIKSVYRVGLGVIFREFACDRQDWGDVPEVRTHVGVDKGWCTRIAILAGTGICRCDDIAQWSKIQGSTDDEGIRMHGFASGFSEWRWLGPGSDEQDTEGTQKKDDGAKSGSWLPQNACN